MCQGANFGAACTGSVPNECGATNICTPVNIAKGFDGLPCTADDPVSSQGTASSIPTTTGQASASVVDRDNNAGAQIYNSKLCSNASTCVTTVTGAPFDCTKLLSASPSVSKAALGSAFPQLEGNQTDDDVVTNRQAAK